MVDSILHYRVYLIGVKFVILSDHKPLTEWHKMVPSSLTYSSWLVKLQGLTFDVKYIEGKKNVWADLLSRPFNIKRSSFLQVHEDLKKIGVANLNNSNDPDD